MRPLACALLLCASVTMQSQARPPEQRLVPTFAVHDAPRLSALARLGALTKTSILVEADSLPFLQAPVSLVAQHATVLAVATDILRGTEPYSVREEGDLLIVFSPRNRSRMLTLSLGPFHFTGTSLSMLFASLSSEVSAATGCNRRGWAIAGPALELSIPPMQLTSATFEQIVAHVAQASDPTMWVVEPDPAHEGCTPNPGAHWQVGFYGFGRLFSSCDAPFSESIGPPFVLASTKDAPGSTTCALAVLPGPVPSL